MRTNTVLIRLVFIGILIGAGFVLDPIGAKYAAHPAAAPFGLPTQVLSALVALFSDKVARKDVKILDTSVIIDGRIADVAETGFLSGTIVIPQFILRELQQVADSPDSSKRQRGRRGLDMLNRLQSNSTLDIQIVDTDFQAVKEVDLKLLELSKQLGDAVIVTNDFNLNKVAQLRG